MLAVSPDIDVAISIQLSLAEIGDTIEVIPYLSFANTLNYLVNNGTDVALALFCTDFISAKESNSLRCCEIECGKQTIPFFSLKQRGEDKVEINIFETSVLLTGSMSDNDFWKKVAKIIIFGESPDHNNSRVNIIGRNLSVSDTDDINRRWDELGKEMRSIFNVRRLIALQQIRKVFDNRF